MGLKIYWFSQLNVRARQGRGKPPPFAPQFFETERQNAIDLALDLLCVRPSHG